MSERSNAELPPLPYDYDAIEPHISEQVLEWHHDTHHQGYVDGLNSAEETLAEGRSSGDHSSSGGALSNVTHNGCGHYLHTMFWENMSPDGGGEPSGELADRIEEDFGSYEGWKGEFEAAASAARAGRCSSTTRSPTNCATSRSTSTMTARSGAHTRCLRSTSGSTRTTTTTAPTAAALSMRSSKSSIGTPLPRTTGRRPRITSKVLTPDWFRCRGLGDFASRRRADGRHGCRPLGYRKLLATNRIAII